MSIWKFLNAVVVLGAVVVFTFDAVSVLNAHRDVSDVASASAGAAAVAISNENKPLAKGTKPVSPASAAEATARAHGDVVIDYNYDAATARVKVTVSATAKSLVLHYIDKNLTDNIKASAVAQPG